MPLHVNKPHLLCSFTFKPQPCHSLSLITKVTAHLHNSMLAINCQTSENPTKHHFQHTRENKQIFLICGNKELDIIFTEQHRLSSYAWINEGIIFLLLSANACHSCVISTFCYVALLRKKAQSAPACVCVCVCRPQL